MSKIEDILGMSPSEAPTELVPIEEMPTALEKCKDLETLDSDFYRYRSNIDMLWRKGEDLLESTIRSVKICEKLENPNARLIEVATGLIRELSSLNDSYITLHEKRYMIENLMNPNREPTINQINNSEIKIIKGTSNDMLDSLSDILEQLDKK